MAAAGASRRRRSDRLSRRCKSVRRFYLRLIVSAAALPTIGFFPCNWPRRSLGWWSQRSGIQYATWGCRSEGLLPPPPLRVCLWTRSPSLIRQSIIDEVKRLLAQPKPDGRPLSQRKIAVLLGISRGTVKQVATGRRDQMAGVIARLLRAEEEENDADPTGPPQRCGECGVIVFMPCRACRDRQALTKAKRPPGAERFQPDNLNLQLRPEHRASYEDIHRARKAAGEEPIVPPIYEEKDPAERAA